MIRCTFAGHRDVTGISVSDIMAVLETIILKSDEVIECLVRGMGKFDELSASAVRELKRKYRNRKINLVLVLPYMQQRINEDKAYYEMMYDEIIVPSHLDGEHYKKAIVLRNRWMVEQSEYVIAMVQRRYGGAFAMLQFAEKNKKIIFNLSNEKYLQQG